MCICNLHISLVTTRLLLIRRVVNGVTGRGYNVYKIYCCLDCLLYKPLNVKITRRKFYMVGIYVDDAMLLLNNVSEACGVAEPLREERL